MAFYELRTYEIRPGKIDEWIELMEKEILPMQVARGMVIVGSFRVEGNDELYIWMRRFESEEQRKEQYAAVYESDEWKNNLSPRVGECINRETIKVQRIIPTAMSVLK